MNQLVSVIMPAYNAEKFLPGSLASALAQSYRPLEIVVVDDGSSDGSVAVARSFGAPVTVVAQQNGGPGSARNRGIRESRGSYLAFLDADDLWSPDKIEKQVAVFEGRPDLGLLYTGYRRFLEGDPKAGDPVQVKPVSGRLFGPLYHGRLPIATSTVMLRRSALEKAGLFDEQPGIQGAEDFDLWLRMAQVSEVASLPELLAFYRRSFGGHNRSNIERAYSSSELVRTKHEASFLAEHGGTAQDLEAIRRACHFSHGLTYFDLRNFPEARRFFLSSLKIRPFNGKALAYLLLTLLGKGTLERLKQNRLLSGLKTTMLSGGKK